MTHKQNNLLDELCPLKWHSIRSLHLRILPIAPSPFKASLKVSHGKPSLFKDHLCSMTQDNGSQFQTGGSHISLSLMPFSTFVCWVDPFSVLHPSVPSSYSLWTMSLQIENLRIFMWPGIQLKAGFPSLLFHSLSKGGSLWTPKLSRHWFMWANSWREFMALLKISSYLEKRLPTIRPLRAYTLETNHDHRYKHF